MKYIKDAFQKYLNHDNNSPNPNIHNPRKISYPPYLKGGTHKIAKILKKKEINTCFKPHTTMKQIMISIKDGIYHIKFKGVYKVECSYGKFYIRENGCSLKEIIKEHSGDIRHERKKSSAIAKHAKKTKHHFFI